MALKLGNTPNGIGGQPIYQPATNSLVTALQPKTHEWFIKSEYLDYIRLGFKNKFYKTIELRPDTLTYNIIQEGDIIKFSTNGGGNCTVRITKLIKSNKSIAETLAILDYDQIIAIMPQLAEQYASKQIKQLRERIQQDAKSILPHTFDKNALLIVFEVDNLI